MDILSGSCPLKSGPTGPGSGFSIMPKFCQVIKRNYNGIDYEFGHAKRAHDKLSKKFLSALIRCVHFFFIL